MSPRHQQPGLSSLLTFFVVCFTKYSLLPWVLVLLHSRKYESWSHVVVAYGLLLSSLNLGVYLGQMLASAPSVASSFSSSSSSSSSSASSSASSASSSISISSSSSLSSSSPFSKTLHLLLFGTLTSCYSTIAFISRFPITVVLFCLVGLTGSMLVINGHNVDQRKTVLSFASITSSSTSSSPSPSPSISSGNGTTDDIDSDANIQRYLISFIFSTLIAGLLYDSRPQVDFPCYFLSLFLTCACMMITSYKIIRKVRSNKRTSAASSSFTARLMARRNGEITGGKSKAGLLTKVGNFEDKGEFDAIDYQGDVPLNYLSSCQSDLTKARKMYGKMLAWKKQYDIDNIFDLPQPTFHDILKYYPHAIHGYSLDGCIVVYEILGKGDPSGLKSCGVGVDDLVWHFNLRNELIFNQLASSAKLDEVVKKSVPGAVTKATFPYQPSAALASNGAMKANYVPRLMTVIDVEGISISSVTTDVISFIKKSGEIIDKYYPEQVARLVVCKAPRWFSTIWTVIARALPEGVQKKVDILYDAKGLDKYIHPSQRPIAYGGTEEIELNEGDEHKLFLKIAEDWEKMYGRNADDEIEGKVIVGSEATTNPADSLTSKGRGMFNWISSKFRRPPSAFLGEKNTYKFNESTGKWEMDTVSAGPTGLKRPPSSSLRLEDPSLLMAEDDDSSDSEEESGSEFAFRRSNSNDSSSVMSAFSPKQRFGKQKKSGRMTKEQLEEHGLVLAIHAAHYASSYAKLSSADQQAQPMLTLNHQFGSSANLAGLASPYPSSTSLTNAEYGASRGYDNETGTTMDAKDAFTSSAGGGTTTNSKLSSFIFLIAASIFLLITTAHTMLVTLLPVWLCAPLRSGGLGYGVKDMGLLLSCCGMFVLHGQILLGGKFDHVLKASPVRALRIGSGLLVLTLFILPWYARLYTIPVEDILHHHHHQGGSMESLVLEKHDELQVVTYLSNFLPSLSVSSLLIMSFLIANIVCASYLCRKASGMLLHLVLSTSFNAPVTIRYAIHGVGDVTGPFLCCVVYSIIHGNRLRYPMNSAFFFPLAATGCLLAYILSVFLVVQFRGDYGVMSDHQELKALLWREKHEGQLFDNHEGESNPSSISSSESPSPSGRVVDGLHQRFGSQYGDLGGSSHDMQGSKTSTSSSNSSLDWTTGRISDESLFAIPLGDIGVLFSSMGHGYGSKLYNLKNDFKDV